MKRHVSTVAVTALLLSAPSASAGETSPAKAPLGGSVTSARAITASPSSVPALAPGTAESVTISGSGMNAVTVVSMNSDPIDPDRWTIVDPNTITVDLPQGLLGTNTLSVTDAIGTQSTTIEIVENDTPTLQIGTGDPLNTRVNGAPLRIIAAGKVGTIHRVYYSASNTPSQHPLAEFEIGGGFGLFCWGGTFQIGPNGYTEKVFPATPNCGPPTDFFAQSIDVVTAPAPMFQVSNLQSVRIITID